MSTLQLPAGLTDTNFEFFEKEGEIYLLTKGTTLSYQEFPSVLMELIDRIILKNSVLAKSLDFLGLDNLDARRKQFLSCNFTNFDHNADVTSCMNILNSEYVACPRRGQCAFEGSICTPIKINQQQFTLRELRIMAMIRDGLYDKEIADKLNISVETLKTTKKKIQTKLGVERKAMISNVAAGLQLC